MDRQHASDNREFHDFFNATGYLTFAEIEPDPKEHPGALPHMLRAGSLVFAPPRREMDLPNWTQWWRFKFGANWRRLYGPRSSINGLSDHPVVHVAYRDAEAYAKWARKELPTEAEWELAARGARLLERLADARLLAGAPKSLRRERVCSLLPSVRNRGHQRRTISKGSAEIGVA